MLPEPLAARRLYDQSEIHAARGESYPGTASRGDHAAGDVVALHGQEACALLPGGEHDADRARAPDAQLTAVAVA